MSFSSETKSELCRTALNKPCCVNAELYGILLYCNSFSHKELRIVTEHKPFALRAEKLLYKAAGITPERRTGEERGKTVLYVHDEAALQTLFGIYGLEPTRNPAHHINLGVLEEECCRLSFLRGAFLAGGSITDPAKSYHMELITGHYNVSREAFAILLELGYHPGELSRSGNYINYFKHSEAIEDLLTAIGAPIAAMDIMSAKVEKEITNKVNRRMNCDEANLDKVVNAAQEQIAAIRKLEEKNLLSVLSEKLQEAARLRTENPELSLQQLADMTQPPLSKSSLHHRLKKIMEMAENV